MLLLFLNFLFFDKPLPPQFVRPTPEGETIDVFFRVHKEQKTPVKLALYPVEAKFFYFYEKLENGKYRLIRKSNEPILRYVFKKDITRIAASVETRYGEISNKQDVVFFAE